MATTEQRYYLVNQADKLAALTRLFESEPITSALIFVRTRAGTGELANELSVHGFPAEALNGELDQNARERILNRFRQNQSKVLVATDVAARGLDIDDISHVFNYDLPDEAEIYVHRIGRTARAGKTGIAIALVTPREKRLLRQIEDFTKQPLTRATLPTVEDIKNQREAQLLERVTVWLGRARYQRERELVARLVEAGHDPLEIAAAALKLARADEKQRPIAALSEVRDAPTRQETRPSKAGSGFKRGGQRNYPLRQNTSHEHGMVRLTLSKGRAHGIRPNDVVGTIAFHADIPGHVIGKIHIEDKRTLVDVPEKFLAQVLAKTGDYRIREHPVAVTLV